MQLKRFGAGGRAPRTIPHLPTALVYKGAPKSGNKPGKDLTYFRVEWPDGYDDAAAVFTDLYGSQPSRFDRVMLMSDQIEDSWASAMESWRHGSKGAVLVRRCDGEQIHAYRDGDKLVRNTGEACMHPDCDCAPVGRFTFALPDLIQAGHFMLFRLVTHARNDIDNIGSTLALAYDGSGGRLRSVMFTLYREAAEITTPDGMRVTKHLVRLSLADGAMQRLAAGYADDMGHAINGPVGAPALPETTSASWATRAALNAMLEAFHVIEPHADWDRLCALAGMDPAADPADWAHRYPSEKDAKRAIVAAQKESR